MEQKNFFQSVLWKILQLVLIAAILVVFLLWAAGVFPFKVLLYTLCLYAGIGICAIIIAGVIAIEYLARKLYNRKNRK